MFVLGSAITQVRSEEDKLPVITIHNTGDVTLRYLLFPFVKKDPCGSSPFDFAQGRLGRALPIRVICAIPSEPYFGAGSRLLFLAELLETRIGAQRIEHWIEPEQRRSKRPGRSQCARVRYRE